MRTRTTARLAIRLALACSAASILLAVAGPLGAEAPLGRDRLAGAQPAPPEPSVPDVVTIGFLINDIQDVDLERHRYQVDFYVWYRWTNPDLDPPATVEFMNDAERWATMRTPVSEEPIQLEDGSLYYRERVMSMFKTNLPLENYPYDELDLRIVMEDVALGADELVFVLDDPPVESAATLSVPGYAIGAPTATVVEQAYPEMGEVGLGVSDVSQVVVTIPMLRPWLPYTLKIFVPLLVVVVCAAIVFLVNPEHVDARFGLGISSLLTLIALKWITDGEMPLIDYLGLVDTLYLLTFVFIAVGLAVTTYDTWQLRRGVDNAVLARSSRRTLVVAGSILAVSCAVTVTLFLA